MKNIEKSILASTRKSLHQAVQLVSAVPRNLLPKDPTDGSASLEWNADLKALEALPIANKHGDIRVGLKFEALTLCVSVSHTIQASFDLKGQSVDQAFAWLKAELTKLDLEADLINLTLPYEIEAYDNSIPLEANQEALEAFAQLYQSTKEILLGITDKWTEAFDIRCWPHHFDLATLIPLATDENKEMTKSIGVGLSPGDEGIDEPYVYVNVWPAVDANALLKHELPMGHWNTEGWSGAVLTYSELLKATDQDKSYADFCDTAIAILKE